jgi:hypothetical protein
MTRPPIDTLLLSILIGIFSLIPDFAFADGVPSFGFVIMLLALLFFLELTSLYILLRYLFKRKKGAQIVLIVLSTIQILLGYHFIEEKGWDFYTPGIVHLVTGIGIWILLFIISPKK